MGVNTLVRSLVFVTLGALLGGTVVYINMTPEKVIGKEATYIPENPEVWLIPPGTPFEDIFPDASIRAILEQAESLSLHEICTPDTPGCIQRDRFAFSGQGREASPEIREALLFGIRSVSSYRPSSMCVFNPIVLLRVGDGTESFDMVICFSCKDMKIYRANGESAWGMGMSEAGWKVFVHYSRQLLPDNKVLKGL